MGGREKLTLYCMRVYRGMKQNNLHFLGWEGIGCRSCNLMRYETLHIIRGNIKLNPMLVQRRYD